MIPGNDLKKEWQDFATQESQPAFYRIYTHYYHYLTYLGVKKGANSELVKDVINDVFLFLWESRLKLREIHHFHNYIITIFLRKLFRKESFVEEVNEAMDLPEWLLSTSVEEQLIDREQTAQLSKTVRAYIANLPSRQQQMIYQKFFLNLSYPEIAAANGVSVNTVYNTIYKTLDKLKAGINKELISVLLYVSFAGYILFSN
ncbi:RNA polymerase sigma factor [Chitinophaga sp. 22321]|uniref:Sigma-70 family RNA polymerase sigma factor n=1 Tax=Chitinophaga hostae TaxID=2831022 RepID=A0ABS5J9Q5_9BACT|nr:sigma-70 family RNA polymerase sigma factor [Chitinophaga hostae]MBS0031182.1 sigma-70 family RNA polymerase sigma factor [Chitinophaga hostae]